MPWPSRRKDQRWARCRRRSRRRREHSCRGLVQVGPVLLCSCARRRLRLVAHSVCESCAFLRRAVACPGFGCRCTGSGSSTSADHSGNAPSSSSSTEPTPSTRPVAGPTGSASQSVPRPPVAASGSGPATSSASPGPSCPDRHKLTAERFVGHLLRIAPAKATDFYSSLLDQVRPSPVQAAPLLRQRQNGWPMGSVYTRQP